MHMQARGRGQPHPRVTPCRCSRQPVTQAPEQQYQRGHGVLSTTTRKQGSPAAATLAQRRRRRRRRPAAPLGQRQAAPMRKSRRRSAATASAAAGAPGGRRRQRLGGASRLLLHGRRSLVAHISLRRGGRTRSGRRQRRCKWAVASAGQLSGLPPRPAAGEPHALRTGLGSNAARGAVAPRRRPAPPRRRSSDPRRRPSRRATPPAKGSRQAHRRRSRR